MAAALDPKVFLEQKAGDIAQQFPTLKKNELLALGQHLELEVRAAMKKAEIQEVVLGHLIEAEIIEEGSVKIPKIASMSAVEIRKLELKQELELKKLAHELEQKKLAAELEQKKLAAELEKEKIAAEDRARQEKIAAEERARQEKLDAEERARQDKLAHEKELEFARIGQATDLAKLQSQSGQNLSSFSLSGQVQGQPYFHVAQWFQTVPKFKESAVWKISL